MAEQYKNKYRVPSARWQQHDYGSNVSYFVTICTKSSIHYFGTVETQNIVSLHIASLQKNKMSLSTIGDIANDFWLKIPEHFPFVLLGAFQVMPNHLHGIIIIDKIVETQNIASLQEQQN
jgi:REP element-mobilizing transposase RayT